MNSQTQTPSRRGHKSFRIGCGAGFSGDRLEPAVVLAQHGQLDYLVLECLAERTIALAQKRRLQDPAKGYDPFLERRITSLLPHLVQNNVCLITNMGAANPIEAAKKVIEIANKQGLKIKVAAVYGDDISNELGTISNHITQFNNEAFAIDLIKNHTTTLGTHGSTLTSANAYLGVEGVLEALRGQAQIVITGRVADPSLFLAPMIHEFDWPTDNYDLMGKGTVIGHLLECAGHLTGGYFADPICKPVENPENLGHPFADVLADGSAIMSKVEGTGGVVDLRTAKEQLLYEVTNPHQYYTPDVVADFMTVHLEEIAPNKVRVTGGTGQQKPATYKVSIGYKACLVGEGEISYAGPSALERAELAAKTIQTRIAHLYDEFRVDYIGQNSIFRDNNKKLTLAASRHEVRLRIAAKTQDPALAQLVGEEVEALYTNGPAGGGGVRKYVTEVIGVVSILADRRLVKPKVILFES